MIQIDPNISLGHIVETIALLGSALVYVVTLRSKIAGIESRHIEEARRVDLQFDDVKRELAKQTEILVRLASYHERIGFLEKQVEDVVMMTRGLAADRAIRAAREDPQIR